MATFFATFGPAPGAAFVPSLVPEAPAFNLVLELPADSLVPEAPSDNLVPDAPTIGASVKIPEGEPIPEGIGEPELIAVRASATSCIVGRLAGCLASIRVTKASSAGGASGRLLRSGGMG